MNAAKRPQGSGTRARPERRNGRGFSSVGGILLLAALGGVLAFVLACRLASAATIEEHDSIIAGMIGSARLAFSDRFIIEADRWFHKGAAHSEKAGLTDWFTVTLSNVKPTGHVHLEDEGINEIMPWLWFSAKMNPSNTAAYSVAAFFLAGQSGRPDLAEKALKMAQRANPGDYRLFYERGRLALKMGKLEDAARFLDAASRCWPGDRDPKDDEVMMDRFLMLMHRGLLCEMQEDTGRAILLYEEALRASPARTGLRERLEDLKAFGRSRSSAFDVWKMMMAQHPLVCERDDHGDHE